MTVIFTFRGQLEKWELVEKTSGVCNIINCLQVALETVLGNILKSQEKERNKNPPPKGSEKKKKASVCLNGKGVY